ncbi:MAG: hypothetical protein VR72_09340 [Clostridiaceae bacterium BRH_c20a]|nr:MAG: hypothetical protein VR72_09340 [Clostridiaceae bacterium BRH_c20a]
MQKLVIEKTSSTPYIHFDGDAGYLQIKGESYPENVAKFYTPILEWIRNYLDQESKEMTVEFKITYFNSSTSKVFMTILDLLEQGVIKGRKVSVKWMCDEDNDIAIECGEEFKEDLNQLPFTVEVVKGEE